MLDIDLAYRSARYLAIDDAFVTELITRARGGNSVAALDLTVIIEHARILGYAGESPSATAQPEFKRTPNMRRGTDLAN